MTAKRALDAGWPVSLALVTFVPIANLVTFVVLGLLPSRLRSETVHEDVAENAGHGRLLVVPNLILAAACAIAIGAITLSLSTFVLGEYGAPLFIGAPFLMGFTYAVLGRARLARQVDVLGGCTWLTLIALSLGLVAGAEGAICLIMAAIPVWIMTMVGGVIGFAVVQTATVGRQMSFAIAMLPIWFAVDSVPTAEPVLSVTTSIEIDASIEKAWEHVIRFSEIPPPEEWYFRAGIAYPTRAEIRGKGVGAVRHCMFTTGTFVEPITVWDAPTHLAFDVREQPDALRELSPYGDLHPPHLDHDSGGFRSLRGEFRLESLSANRTRVAGTTWYELPFRPRRYWSFWSDFLIHAIHRRVLNHIKHEAERATD
ncbi:MAG: SRPBCC family protein [Planctomycetes bacterium]|nr:SRPBCC family protein [Planctomycetota bacterium]